VNNKEAQAGLLSMLGLQGIGNEQAAVYLSTIQDCYKGNNRAVCDAYNEWCSTLYDLDHVLEESLPAHLFDTCYREREDGGETIIAYSRSANHALEDKECEEVCNPLSCCYQYENNSDTVVRKKIRQHNNYLDSGDIVLQRRGLESECRQFNPQSPFNSRICNAYSPFCNSLDSLGVDTGTATPSFEPSSVPSKVQSVLPSMRIQQSDQPSSLPSKSVNSSHVEQTSEPSYLNSATPASLAPTIQPTDTPSKSDTPTSQPSQLDTASLSPNLVVSLLPSFTAFPSIDEDARRSILPSSSPSSPSYETRTTNQPSNTGYRNNTNQPSAKLSNYSSPSYYVESPISSEVPTIAMLNATETQNTTTLYHESSNPSSQPSSLFNTSMPSVEP